MPVSPARRFAFRVLLRVETDAAFSSELLHTPEMATPIDNPALPKIHPRDHALAMEIALGVLRRRGQIDHLLAQAGRPVGKLDPEVRAALRIGCYQLQFLDRIPPRAAVSESVELVKMARKRSAAGLVNAVLRKLPARGSIDDLPESLSYPAWLVERWQKNYGIEQAQAIMRSGLHTPPTYLRLNRAFDADQTVTRLSREGVETEPTGLPLTRRVTRGRPRQTQAFAEGRIRIQDISSQCIVPLLDLQPGNSFLDLCAAPGGKTFQAIETLGSARGVVAADRYPHRLNTLRRLGTSPVDCMVLDARADLPLRQKFDRILVDAPCSGTGTLARNPDIKWRLSETDLAALAEKQKAILRQALEHLAPDGVLVYATCSLEPEENQQVVDTILKEKPSLARGAYLERVPGREPGDGFWACQLHR